MKERPVKETRILGVLFLSLSLKKSEERNNSDSSRFTMDLTKVLALVYFLCSAGLLSQQYLSKCDLNCVPFCSPVVAIVSANAQLIETKANPF